MRILKALNMLNNETRFNKYAVNASPTPPGNVAVAKLYILLIIIQEEKVLPI
jgi:hypothetical protein